MNQDLVDRVLRQTAFAAFLAGARFFEEHIGQANAIEPTESERRAAADEYSERVLLSAQKVLP